ncbi:MAG: DNA-processing protein DprA [Sporomusaceae bacterium]|nr:DNA-processing protein DprA [Sporomusaceae bacterium]
MENYYIAALLHVSGIGRAKIDALIQYFGSAQQAWLAPRGDLFLSKILPARTCNNLLVMREQLNVEILKEKWDRQNIRLCSPNDKEYPCLLNHIYESPCLLFYRGVLPEHDRLIAIVGARKATAYGRNAAQYFGTALAESDYWVVSGAARGIDTAAHRGALLRGHTIAVLGCGVDIAYPPENKKLLLEIAECGAVVSEYLPGTSPSSGHFPARNRLISGMSRGVLVVEAGTRSGSLITADRALEEGRDVYAIPGSIFSKMSEGTNHLIQQGAKLVQKMDDILEEDIEARSFSRSCALSPEEKSVYSLLNYEEPLSLEAMAVQTSVNISDISYILLQLELRGLVVQHSGHGYVRSTKEVIE